MGDVSPSETNNGPNISLLTKLLFVVVTKLVEAMIVIVAQGPKCALRGQRLDMDPISKKLPFRDISAMACLLLPLEETEPISLPC